MLPNESLENVPKFKYLQRQEQMSIKMKKKVRIYLIWICVVSFSSQ
jgi:hypothetical protein